MMRSLLNRLLGRPVETVTVLYDPIGRPVSVRRGETLLSAIERAQIRHGSVCGGDAKCATCRVRIDRGLETLPSPSGRERQTLDRLKADDTIRLACQIRPTAPLTVTPQLPGTRL